MEDPWSLAGDDPLRGGDVIGAKPRRCCECWAGEHPNYDDDVRFSDVRDRDSGQLRVRGYLCEEHRRMFIDDGYVVKTKPTGRR